MSELVQDLEFGCHTLLKSRGFTAFALATLALGIGDRDPGTIAGVAGLLVVVTLLACYLPARRATKVNPIIALRCE